MILDRKFME